MNITNISLRGIINWINNIFNNKTDAFFNDQRITKIVRSEKDENDIFTKITFFDSVDRIVRESTLSGTSPTYMYRIETDYNENEVLIETKYFLQNYDIDENWIGETQIDSIE